MKRAAPVILALLAALLFGVPNAHATACTSPCTMTDGAASATVSPNSQAGMFSWVADGVGFLYQQWFWYSIGTGAAKSLDTLPLVSADMPDASDLDLTYANSQIQITVKYSLNDGSNPATGHVSSDIGELIKIKNLSGSTIADFRFFQYSDFDLAPNLQDSVEMKNSNTVDQKALSGSPMVLSESVVTPSPTKFELNTYANTLNYLNSGGTNVHLATANTGPYPSAAKTGDVTWAFEWDTSIGSGNSFTISKDKNLSGFVPEPAALFLLGGCLLFIGRKMASRVAS
jgi:hypothetical protein